MALSKESMRAAYPLPAYNYRVTIQDDAASPTLSFSEVSGLNIAYEPVIYRHGMSYATGSQIIPGMRQPVELTMRQGMARDRVYLLEWLKAVHRNPLAENHKRNILVDLCDEAGFALIRWTVNRAMPIRLETSDLSAATDAVAIASMTFIAQDLRIHYLAAER